LESFETLWPVLKREKLKGEDKTKKSKILEELTDPSDQSDS